MKNEIKKDGKNEKQQKKRAGSLPPANHYRSIYSQTIVVKL